MNNKSLSVEEVIGILEQNTAESIYQKYLQNYSKTHEKQPNPNISAILRHKAEFDYAIGQKLLREMDSPENSGVPEHVKHQRVIEIYDTLLNPENLTQHTLPEGWRPPKFI